MSGPWEQYASPASAVGPWARYAPSAMRETVDPDATQPAYDALGNVTGTEPARFSEAYSGTNPVDALSRGLVSGATLRGGDELTALGVAAAGGKFSESLADSQKRNKAAREAHPYIYGASEVAGVIPGLVYGGATNLGAKALGLVGKTLATRSAASAASGAGLGAVEGFLGEDGSIENRLTEGARAGATGAVLGSAAPSVGAAVGHGVEKLVDAIRPKAAPTGIAGSAAELLAKDLEMAGGANAIRHRMDQLGPDAMLLDASPSFQGRAQGLAVRPETKEAILDPLIARNQATNQRLASDLDAAIGPTPVPSRIESSLDDARGSLAPAYEAVLRNAKPVSTHGIANILDSRAATLRGPAQRAVKNVREMLNNDAGELDKSARTLLSTRQAIDGMIGKEADANVVRALTQARQMVDYEIKRKVPGIKKVDAQYEELARQSAGLQRGHQVLDGGKTAIRPEELAENLANGAVPRGAAPHGGSFASEAADIVGPSAESFRIRQGTRAEIDRLVGNRANDLEALKQAIKGDGDWNRTKLTMVFGSQQAAKIMNAVDRESAFRQAYNNIVQNSMTAPRLAAAEGVKVRGEGPTTNDIGTIIATATGGLPGAALAGGARAARYGINQVQNGADLARNADLAKVLTMMSGPELTKMMETISRRLEGGRLSKAAAQHARELMQMITLSQGDRAPSPQLLR